MMAIFMYLVSIAPLRAQDFRFDFRIDHHAPLSEILTDGSFLNELTPEDGASLARILRLNGSARVADVMTAEAFHRAKELSQSGHGGLIWRLSATLFRNGFPSNLSADESALFERAPEHALFAPTRALPLPRYIYESAFHHYDVYTVLDLLKHLNANPYGMRGAANIGPARNNVIMNAASEYFGGRIPDVRTFVASELEKANAVDGTKCQVDLSSVSTADIEAELKRRGR